MCGGAGPRSRADFAAWAQRRLLNPASAMSREGGLLLREEPSITDPAPYAATLRAVSAGASRRSEIAAALGRPASAIAHLLGGLEDIGLIEQLGDALPGKRTVFPLAEPIIRLHQLITARYEPELVAGRADRVWKRSAATVSAKIFGPHFEELTRQWCMHYADEQTLGAIPGAAQPTSIACREHKGGHELNLVVTEAPGDKSLILAIGASTEVPKTIPGDCPAR